MFKWMKKHKVLVILCCVALVGGGAFLYIRHSAQEAMARIAELSEETAFVERRSIQSTISSTGHIMSDNTKAVSTTLTGVEVLSMHVEVGDVVAEGDVICTFDTSDIEEGISDAEDVLSAAEVQSDVTVNNAKRGLEMAVETQNYQIEAAARAVLNAHNAWMAASESYDLMSDRLEKAKEEALNNESNVNTFKKLETVENNLASAYEEYAAAESNLYDRQSELDDLAYIGTATEGELNAAQSKVDAASAKVDEAQEKIDDINNNLLPAAQAAVDELSASGVTEESASKLVSAAQANLESIEASMITAENSLRQARIAYDNAVSTYDYTVASQLSQYEGSKDALKSARASAGVSTISQENNLENYREQLEKGVLKTSISGTVTAVNLEEGDMYTGGPVVTIQDTADMVVSAEIDEYDIADVSLGMKAVFKTDSTRDEQLEGTVTFISPTPTAGSDVTYQVKVAIKSDATRLRLGMNAKLNIILDETGDVLSVPYDAVQQDDAGNDVVYVVERGEDGTVTKTAIPVTVGVEGDYYVEVSGDIAEGMEVAMPSDEIIDIMAMMQPPGMDD